MKTDNLIARKIRENAVAKINYRSDFDGRPHFIKGILVGENNGSFFVEGLKYGDVAAIPKNGIISMIFSKPNDQRPKSVVVPGPVTKPYSKKKEEFSYGNWWKNANVQEAKE